MQTNEVQRCFGLVSGFLSLARQVGDERPLDLIELGPSAGLNLLWDRYRYRYQAGDWGPADAKLELAGEERRPVPRALLELAPTVRGRLGIDLKPIDVTTEHGARLLQAFVWADQRGRLERLRRAIDALREAPPRLVQGDYVELLPELLAQRDEGGLTVVYQTASTVYLTDEARGRLLETLEEAGAAGPLAWLSTQMPDTEDVAGGYLLELRVWPDGEPRVIEHFDFHGAWLDWGT